MRCGHFHGHHMYIFNEPPSQLRSYSHFPGRRSRMLVWRFFPNDCSPNFHHQYLFTNWPGSKILILAVSAPWRFFEGPHYLCRLVTTFYYHQPCLVHTATSERRLAVGNGILVNTRPLDLTESAAAATWQTTLACHTDVVLSVYSVACDFLCCQPSSCLPSGFFFKSLRTDSFKGHLPHHTDTIRHPCWSLKL